MIYRYRQNISRFSLIHFMGNLFLEDKCVQTRHSLGISVSDKTRVLQTES